ncbi:MAG: helix-turn-helix transcriptional regulator [Bacteroidetes bacterium]|nr:helix-turn-helix transcriptional regulator [Bacteroidota bacterium]
MSENTGIQEKLFNLIKSKLAPNISFVHDLSELLGISYDSAYRRIRGQKDLTLDELQLICAHYRISMDEILNFNSDNVSFTTLAIGKDGFTFEGWLHTLLEEMKKIYECKNRDFIYAAKDVPIFYYFEFPEIAAFKFFFWHKVLIPSANYKNEHVTLEVPEALFETGRSLLRCYMKIPVIEIWSEDTISSIIRQIEYCLESGFFKQKEDALRLCDVLDLWLEHVQSQAEHGFQYMLGRPPEGIENSYKLFQNEVLVNDNTIMVHADGRKTAYLTYNIINQLITNNPVFCDQIEASLRNLMQKSTMISGTSAKERYRFFNSLHEKVKALRLRTERMDSSF